MLNIIRADIYRILRGKALYITLIVLLAVSILNVMSMYSFETGAITFYMPAGLEDEVALLAPQLIVNGVNMPRLIAIQMENFVFFLLPVIVIVAGAIFSHGTVKNDLAWGVSRVKLYFSKLILASIICVLLMLFFVASATVGAIILGGIGGSAPPGHWMEILQIYSAQLLFMLSYISIGVFLAFVTRRVAAINGAYMAYIFVPLFIITIIVGINGNLSWLLDFEKLTNVMLMAELPNLETHEIVRALGIGSVILASSTIGGIALFRRAEIK